MRLYWREEIARTAAAVAEAERRRFVLFIVLLLTSLTFLSLWGDSPDRGPIAATLSRALTPIHEARLRFTRWATGGAERISDIMDQGAQLASLRKKVLDLEREALEARLGAERLAAASSVIGGGTSENPRVLRASVVGGSRKELQWIVTDRGSLDGVQVYDGVLVPEGIIGVVDSVLPRASRVLLATDRNSAIGVRVKDPQGGEMLEGIVRGMPDGTHLVLEVKGAHPLPPETPVVTSPLSTVFPADLKVGTIGERLSARGGLFDRYVVTPTAAPFRADQVLILMGRRSGEAVRLGGLSPIE
jgi:cell shape-determining protein MreC